ncbi:MAG TPA: MFS transporter [Deltaproteobacteria bacterium]|nr:MFS transporter [Deltaproteobacteria bacterium]
MKDPGRRAVFSWALYDWANSAFATTVMAGFFPIFFKQYWCAGMDSTVSTARLGMGNSLSGIVIALASPVLGAIADKGTAKKRFLVFFALTGIIMTSSMVLIPKGAWMLALGVYTLAIIGFLGGNVFYDSLLPGVASGTRMHFVSSLGFSLGYLGGGLLFAFNVWMTLKPSLFGLSNASQAVRLSFLSVGIWWLVFSTPLVLFVRERRSPGEALGIDMIKAGFRQLGQTFRTIRRMKTIFLFLAAYWFYIDGVNTIVLMAVDYGLSIGFRANDLIPALLITQFVGFPCALLFGRLGQRIGAKRSILIAIGVYLIISVFGSFITFKYEFYILAVMIGFVQGGIQSLSRSFYARIIPEGRSAEYFGFYNMLGKFAVIIGPILIGTTGLLLRNFGIVSTLASRIGIVSISLLFLTGGILFSFVDEQKGIREAAYLKNDQAYI